METVLENEDRIKEIFKTAIVEILEERKDLFSDLFREVTEDIALAKPSKKVKSLPQFRVPPCLMYWSKSLESRVSGRSRRFVFALPKGDRRLNDTAPEIERMQFDLMMKKNRTSESL